MSVQTARRLPLTALRLALAGAATAGMVALVGCSGSNGPDSTAPAPSAQTASSTESSPSTRTSSASSPEATSAETSDTSSSAGDSGDKPSKQQVRKGLAKFYRTSQKMSPDKAKAFAKCMTNQLYGDVSNDLLIMMRDGKPDPAKMSSADKNKLGKAGLKCQHVL